jgi:outer membrane murein-binding lipoprotein Lpp
MKPLSRAASCLLALVVAAGCASTEITDKIAAQLRTAAEEQGWI